MENEVSGMHIKMCIVHIFMCIFLLNTLLLTKINFYGDIFFNDLNTRLTII